MWVNRGDFKLILYRIVEFETREDAIRAIDELNDST